MSDNRVHKSIQQAAIRAWHGSPHDFDQFEDKAIGSGEGAQVYGHGHYVAERKGIAESYRDTLSKRQNNYGEQGYTFDGRVSHHDFGTHLRDLWELKDYERRNEYTLAQYAGSDDEHHKETVREIRDNIKAMKAQIEQDQIEHGLEPDGLHHLDHHDIQHLINVDNHVLRQGFKPSLTLDRSLDDAEYAMTRAHQARANPPELRGYDEGGSTAERRARLLPIVNKMIPNLKKEGRLYELAIQADPSKMLDWDNEIIHHPPEMVSRLAAAADISVADLNDAFENEPGEDVYRALVSKLGSAPAATEALLKAGVHGIKYRDASSRSRDEPPVLMYKGKPISQYAFTQQLPVDVMKAFQQAEGTAKHFVDETFEQVLNRYKNPSDDLSENDRNEVHSISEILHKHKDDLSVYVKKPTYNYVIFDPRMIAHVKKYGMQGELIKDYGGGAHVRPVDHDPFEEK